MFLIFKNQKFRKLKQIITFCEIFVCIWRKSPEYNLRQRISLYSLKTYVNVMRIGMVYAILKINWPAIYLNLEKLMDWFIKKGKKWSFSGWIGNLIKNRSRLTHSITVALYCLIKQWYILPLGYFPHLVVWWRFSYGQ